MAGRPSPPDDGKLAAALLCLPMFPLKDVVLLPHAVLPLHIFEPRYRKMTGDALTSHRMLAMALQIGDEQPGGPPPGVHPVAGVGEILMAHELPDGRFFLFLHGRARVHIDHEIPSDEPYRLVRATAIPDVLPADLRELRDADASLRVLAHKLGDSVEGGERLKRLVAEQETPAELVDVLGAALITAPSTRQWLLETADVLRRMERLSAELVVMMARLGAPQPGN